MKKIISVVLVIVLMLSVITGCSDKKNESQNVSTVDSYDSEGCEAILDEIMYYEMYSAGSSLKAVISAAEILNWTERNQADRKTLSVTVDDYIEGLSNDDRERFYWNFLLIDGYAEGIIDKDQSVMDLISDAGAKLDFTSYSEDKYEVFSDAVKMKLGIDLD